MLLYGDYHTHSTYSKKYHAKGTVLENASVAADKGLKEIAITDHGFNHEFFGINRREMSQLREDALNAKEITGVDVLVGIESNLISLDGEIDLKEEDFSDLDVVLMGVHKMVSMPTFRDKALITWANMFDKVFQPSKERINRNTTALLKTLDKYPIDVITHLNYGFQTDTIAIAKMAKQKNVFVELNGKRINFTDEEIQIMRDEGVKFILNSDAHNPESVGEVNNGMNLVYKYDIPLAQVANVDKLPKFNNKRGF